MGNSMNKILPGLYIGSLKDSKDFEQISANNITHILSILDYPQPKPVFKKIKYKFIRIADRPHENISRHFKESIRFIHKARSLSGNVLVHCLAGVSRSSTICIAYLMTIADLKCLEALKVVHFARKEINPNFGFKAQLQAFESQSPIKIKNKLIKRFGEIKVSDIEYIKKIQLDLDKNVS
ncbi:dual specificity protein phosphatase 22-like [Hydra vulgaris]|uniref:Dual specificity protein phosphatase 22-like n=1 Tax=Hydra vulgaris TaxID=6087 RepID=A0ABM4DQE5_HYDVU